MTSARRAHGGGPDVGSVSSAQPQAVLGPATATVLVELLEPWRAHRQRIVRLIGASGFRKPRFGPRMTIQDHRVH